MASTRCRWLQTRRRRALRPSRACPRLQERCASPRCGAKHGAQHLHGRQQERRAGLVEAHREAVLRRVGPLNLISTVFGPAFAATTGSQSSSGGGAGSREPGRVCEPWGSGACARRAPVAPQYCWNQVCTPCCPARRGRGARLNSGGPGTVKAARAPPRPDALGSIASRESSVDALRRVDCCGASAS